MHNPTSPNTVRVSHSRNASDIVKERTFIINQWKNLKSKKQSKCSHSQGNLKILHSNQNSLVKKSTFNLGSERSTQISTEGDLFNDKYISENISRLEIQKKLQEIRLKNFLLKQKVKSSAEQFLEYHQQNTDDFESKQTQLKENFLQCYLAIDTQRQRLINNEQILSNNKKELTYLNGQEQNIKNSIIVTNQSNINTIKDQIYKSKLKQIKQKQLLLEFSEYINQLEFKYQNHLECFKEYLLQLKGNINSMKVEFDCLKDD